MLVVVNLAGPLFDVILSKQKRWLLVTVTTKVYLCHLKFSDYTSDSLKTIKLWKMKPP